MTALLIFFAALFYLLAVYGAANAVAVLNFGKFYIHPWATRIPVVRHIVKCVACSAAWIGVLVSLVFFSPTSLTLTALSFHLPQWKTVLVDGAAASAVSYLLYSLTEYWDPVEPASIP